MHPEELRRPRRPPSLRFLLAHYSGGDRRPSSLERSVWPFPPKLPLPALVTYGRAPDSESAAGLSSRAKFGLATAAYFLSAAHIPTAMAGIIRKSAAKRSEYSRTCCRRRACQRSTHAYATESAPARTRLSVRHILALGICQRGAADEVPQKSTDNRQEAGRDVQILKNHSRSVTHPALR